MKKGISTNSEKNSKSVKQTSIFCLLCLLLGLSSCSIQKMAYNKIAPPAEKKYNAQQKILKLTENGKFKDGGNPVLALTGEDDVELVSEVFPVVLKTYDMLYFNDPTHDGVALMLGELYIMYANAFVEKPAKYMPDTLYEEKNRQFLRAKKFYMRGSKYTIQSLESEYHNFDKNIFSVNKKEQEDILNLCQIYDAEALFWTASGILGAFALEPMDPDVIDKISGAILMLEKAAELQPDFNSGGIWEILASYYMAAPPGLGGGENKAKDAYNKAIKYSKNKKASTYVTFATAFCIPKQDGKSFDAALENALSINPDDNPENRLMTVITQNEARWLKEHKEDFIFE